jgi:hypothetical protein
MFVRSRMPEPSRTVPLAACAVSAVRGGRGIEALDTPCWLIGRVSCRGGEAGLVGNHTVRIQDAVRVERPLETSHDGDFFGRS